jgi:hypothetical protein
MFSNGSFATVIFLMLYVEKNFILWYNKIEKIIIKFMECRYDRVKWE